MHVTVLVNQDSILLLKDVIPAVNRPYRRIKWVFQVFRVADSTGHMKVSQKAHAIGPCVGTENSSLGLHIVGNLLGAGKAAAQHRIRLVHVIASLICQIPEIMPSAVHLTACNPDIRHLP